MNREEAERLLDSHASQLSEMFDAVLILGSFLEPDGTTACIAGGQGNWYARQGMAAQFIARAKAEGLVDEIRRDEDQPDDDLPNETR
jgi:hypothetical protein